MCAPARPLRPLLCLLVLAVARALGVVTAPSSVSVGVGQPLNLSCSVSTGTGDTIHQVRWLDKHKRPLLAYRPGSPDQISLRDPNVRLGSSRRGSSHITLVTLRPEDEGCFLCVFDVYPRGPQQGKMCVTLTGNVKLRNTTPTTAIAGQAAALSCSYTLPAKALQVLWRKVGGRGHRSTVASYSKHGLSVDDAFLNRVTLSANVSDSELSIRETKVEDEACYTCEFHTYPDGTKSAMTCLVVYVLPEPAVNYVTLSSVAVEANCSAQSRPSAQVEWDFGGDNRTLGPPVSSSYNRSDGTTTVTSTVVFKSEALSDVKCIIHHPGLEKPLVLPLTNVGPSGLVLLTLCVGAVVSLLCLCGCICKCFVCNND